MVTTFKVVSSGRPNVALRPPAPQTRLDLENHVAHGFLLLHAPSWPRRSCTALLSVHPAILHAHQRRHVEGAHYHVVIPSTQESEVRGTLVEGLTDGNIWRLGIFKSDECERKDVEVRALESEGRAGDAEHRDVQGDEVSAQTYVWIAR